MCVRWKVILGCRYSMLGEGDDEEVATAAPGQESRKEPWAPAYDLRHQSSAW